ncbi:MAG: GEVED domain-containing protein, partial [Bacteroidia bacterium]|nr:GEVED domain-containing protein [Bacteroidia bacterium]
GIPDSWLWTFDPPTVEFVSGQNTAAPCVRFLNEGAYTVSLTVSNSAGTDVETKINYVFVTLDYCRPQYVFSGTPDYIARVRLADIDNATAAEPDGYSLFVSPNPSLNRGQSYQLTVVNGPTANEYVGAWIDFNRNGVFDAQERLGEMHLSAPGQTQSLSFVVPNDAGVGLNRLRVRMAYQEQNVSPCGLHQYGEAEDYYVTIVASSCQNPPIGGTASGPATAPAFSVQTYTLSGHSGAVQWQYSLDGTNWFNVPGVGGPQLSIQLQYDNQTVRIRAMVSSPGCDPVYSNVVSTQVLPLAGNTPEFAFNIADFPYYDERNTGNFTPNLEGQTAPDVFYRFSAPNCLETLRISTCGSAYDVHLFVLDAALNVVAQAQNNCSTLGAHLQLNGLVWGQTYYIVVSGVNGQFGDYFLSVWADFGSGGVTVYGGPDVSIPCGGSALLTATAAGGSGQYLIQWDGAWIEGPVLEVFAAGVYTVRAYDVGGAGCMAVDTVVVTLQGSALSVQIQPSQAYLCDGQSRTLNAVVSGASGAVSCVWNTGQTGTQIFVEQAGLYSCTCEDEEGCTAFGTAQILYAPAPIVDLGPNAQACVGSVVTLDAGNPGSTYLWSTGEATRVVQVPLNQIGVVVVAVTVVNQWGCVAQGEIEITVSDAPQTQLPEQSSVCSGQTLTLIPGIVGAQYLWSDGSTEPFYRFHGQEPGLQTIRVQISTGAGCFVVDSVSIITLPSPRPDLGPDRTVCPGSTLTLDAGVPEAEYLWSNGAATPSISVSGEGEYWVEVSYGICSARDTIRISFVPPPSVTAVLPDTVRVNKEFEVFAVGTADEFRWEFGSSAVPQTGFGQIPQTVYYTETGTKYVRLTVFNDGCAFVFADSIYVADSVSSRGGEPFDERFVVYPNPAKDFATIRVPFADVRLEVYDAAARLVFDCVLKERETILPIDERLEGICQLKFVHGKRVIASRKLCVVR